VDAMRISIAWLKNNSLLSIRTWSLFR